MSHYGLVAVGIIECILVGWFFHLDIIRKHVNKVSSIQLGKWWNFLIKFFIPGVLIIILCGDIYNELKSPYEDYSWTSLILIGRDWLLATLIAAFVIASRPWKTEKISEKGRAV